MCFFDVQLETMKGVMQKSVDELGRRTKGTAKDTMTPQTGVLLHVIPVSPVYTMSFN